MENLNKNFNTLIKTKAVSWRFLFDAGAQKHFGSFGKSHPLEDRGFD